jgi:alpha-1,3-mannosyl-glycoprotein beta-1,2-N-acetylglucosaminyltransferase
VLLLVQLFFECLGAPRLLFLEDDLLVSPDFFSYFEAGAWVLYNDESVWCISAWNDHGQAGRARNNTALYRTDVMPGLGWMLNAWTAHQLISTWPTGIVGKAMHLTRVAAMPCHEHVAFCPYFPCLPHQCPD